MGLGSDLQVVVAWQREAAASHKLPLLPAPRFWLRVPHIPHRGVGARDGADPEGDFGEVRMY